MPARSQIAIHISLALKQASKGLRERLKDKDWMVREAAEHELAGIIEQMLTRSFDIEQKPMVLENRYPGHQTASY